MRKRLILGTLLFIGLNHLIDWGPFDLLATFAQSATAVTGTITDPNGLPYSGAVINVQLAPAPSGPARCGNSTLQSQGSTDADLTGTFSLSLCPNASIIPGGSQWQFNVSIPGVPPPLGTGPQVFSVLITIAGASQDVSAALSAAAPALSNIVGGVGGASIKVNGGSLLTSPVNFQNQTTPFNGLSINFPVPVGSNIQATLSGTETTAIQPATTVNAVTNDTNVTGSIAAQTLTLGWTGTLGVVRGGTGANLSGTGGTSQVLKQTSVGGSITVAQLAFTDISGLIALAQTPLTTVGDQLCVSAGPVLARCANGIGGAIWTAVASAPGNWVVPGTPVRTVAGTSDTILGDTTSTQDRAKLINYTSGSAIGPVPLGQIGTAGFTNNFIFKVFPTGAGTLTITPTTSTINGQSSLAILPNVSCVIDSDNVSNYLATCGNYIKAGTNLTAVFNADGSTTLNASAGGTAFPVTVSGTVTSGGIPCFTSTTNEASSALLTANAIVVGGGIGVCPSTPSATSTLNSSGNMSLPGTLAVTGHVTLEGVTSTGATGSGLLVFNNGPTFIAPVLGTPASGTLTNATGLPINGVVSATGAIAAIALGNIPLPFTCAITTDAQDCFAVDSSSAATGGTLTNGLANQAQFEISTLTNSTATPLEVSQGSITNTVATPLAQFEGTWNNASLVGSGVNISITNTLSAAGSLPFNVLVGNVSQFKVDKAGVGSFATSVGTGTQPATVFGTGGGLSSTEGTIATGLSTADTFSADSTLHCYHMNFNNVDWGCPNGETAFLSANVIPKQLNATSSVLVASLLADSGTQLNYTGTGGLLLNPASVSGAVSLKQGTTQSAGTTAITLQAPTAVTSYVDTLPGVAAQGTRIGTVASAVITEAFSGDANHSAVVTTGSGTSIGSTQLCSTANCPVGTYRVNVYLDITTACGTSGTYIVNLIYTDDQGAKTIPVNINGTGAVPATGTLTTTSTANYGENAQVIRSTGAASINYSTTATACGTAGPMVGKLYLSVEPVQ
jgi:hypothetical protein